MDDADDIRQLARSLTATDAMDPLLDRVGDARLVLLGEASHGTHEYYAWRAEATRRLLTECGFAFVAVEGDFPDCRVVHRTVTHAQGATSDAREALGAFDRWPTWMWANQDVLDFARWLHRHNAELPPERRVGFHGLDVYSLWESMEEIVGYVREHEPALEEAAVAAYRCFEPYGEDPQSYALATRFVPESCEAVVVRVLREMCERHATDGAGDREERFVAEQNAAVAAGAERYYRAMVRGGAASWNVRDVHMADTLDRLLDHYGPGARGVVWEHNTHIGDARATDMAGAGMVNLGQLARERHGDDDVVLVGFAGHRGGVLAGTAWGAPGRAMELPRARAGSVEDLLFDALGDEPSLLVLPPREEQDRWARTSLAHRAVGVVYSPERERWGNYVPSTMGDRYDALLWFGATTPLRPLAGQPSIDREPETHPTGA